MSRRQYLDYPSTAPPSYEAATSGSQAAAGPVGDGATQPSAGETAVDDLDVLLYRYFCLYLMPDLSHCDYYSEEFVGRLEKFATLCCPRGPIFSVTKSISGLRWEPLDDEYHVLCLGGQKAYFWFSGSVETLSLSKSKHRDTIPAELVMSSFLLSQTATLAELTGPHYPTPPPWTNKIRFISVPGNGLITNNLYNTRDSFYFERKMPRLRPSQVAPGSVVVMQFTITHRGERESIERAFRAHSAFLLWSPPTAPITEAAEDVGPSLAQVLGLDEE